ncbi:translational GTPase TypA [Babesia caballi]|uniref:Translational GTPase TypA n=1 Tax=Babesia caballi TaxID=5871 RepID=A0AAV4LVP9_BABCB|nr:translational GTPase TypA [Babesia caballi]
MRLTGTCRARAQSALITLLANSRKHVNNKLDHAVGSLKFPEPVSYLRVCFVTAGKICSRVSVGHCHLPFGAPHAGQSPAFASDHATAHLASHWWETLPVYTRRRRTLAAAFLTRLRTAAARDVLVWLLGGRRSRRYSVVKYLLLLVAVVLPQKIPYHLPDGGGLVVQREVLRVNLEVASVRRRADREGRAHAPVAAKVAVRHGGDEDGVAARPLGEHGDFVDDHAVARGAVAEGEQLVVVLAVAEEDQPLLVLDPGEERRVDGPDDGAALGHVEPRDLDFEGDEVPDANVAGVVDVHVDRQVNVGEVLAKGRHVGQLPLAHADEPLLGLHRNRHVLADGLGARLAALNVRDALVGEVRNLEVGVAPAREALDQAAPEVDDRLGGHHPAPAQRHVEHALRDEHAVLQNLGLHLEELRREVLVAVHVTE